MKIGAIAFFGITGVEHVATAPAGPGFVITHVIEDVVVNGASFLELRIFSGRNFGSQLCRQAGGWHEFVGRGDRVDARQSGR